MCAIRSFRPAAMSCSLVGIRTMPPSATPASCRSCQGDRRRRDGKAADEDSVAAQQVVARIEQLPRARPCFLTYDTAGVAHLTEADEICSVVVRVRPCATGAPAARGGGS